MEPNTYRERLRRFLAKYSPEKMGNLNDMLAKYTGHEERLFASLVKKYGPEPSSDPGPQVAPVMDPTLNIPFAIVPSGLLPKFSFLEPLAVYYCDVVGQIVGKKQKDLVTFLTKDSIYFAKKDTSALARRISYPAIRAVYTNAAPRRGGQPPPAVTKTTPFVVFLLSPQEKTDMILVGAQCHDFYMRFRKVWAATGFLGRVPFEERDVSAWPFYTSLDHNFRTPQSSRDGNVSTATVERRDVLLRTLNERLLDEDFPDGVNSHDGGSYGLPDDATQSSRGLTPSPSRSAMRAVTFRDPVHGVESPSLMLMPSDPNTFNVHVELPYVSFADDEKAAFPQLSQSDRAMFFCERVYLFQPSTTATAQDHAVSKMTSRMASGALVDCFVLLSAQHIYCLVTEDRLLRCAPISKLQRLFWVKDVSEAQFATIPGVIDDKSRAFSALLQFQEARADATSPTSESDADESGMGSATLSNLSMSRVPRRLEHDLLLLFVTEEKLQHFSRILEQILARAHPTNGIRFSVSAHLGLTNASLPAHDGFKPVMQPLPAKLDAKSSEALMRAKSAGGVGMSAKKSSSPQRMASALGIRRVQSQSPGSSSSFIRDSGVANSGYSGLMSIVRDDPLLLDEFPVPSALKERHPPLATGSVYWAGRVMYHPSPLRKQAGQRSSEMVVAFITRSQFVIGDGGEHIRIMPLQAITAIRVKTIPRKSGEHSRQTIVFVGNQQQHDLCVEIDREEEGRIMLNQLLVNIKRRDPYNIPAIRPFDDPEKENFRFEPTKFYMPPELDLPINFDTVAYRREIHQRVLKLYQKHKPHRVEKVKALCHEFEGRELELLEKMRLKFGSDVDDVADDVFGYRKRLVRFCEQYLPESIDMVDRVLREYRGQEDRLFVLLVQRFGEEPPDPERMSEAEKKKALRLSEAKARLQAEDPRQRLERFYNKYQPNKLGMIDEILAKYRSDSELQTLFLKLEKLYGPEPLPEDAASAVTLSEPRGRGSGRRAPKSDTAARSLEYSMMRAAEEPTSSPSVSQEGRRTGPPGIAADESGEAVEDPLEGMSMEERFHAMARRYFPNKPEAVSSVLAKLTSEAQRREVLTQLVTKYGPEPIPKTPNTRDRLANFFSNHMEERMPDAKLDAILDSFSGSEKDLHASLAKRYGATGPFTAIRNLRSGKAAKIIESSSEDEEETAIYQSPSKIHEVRPVPRVNRRSTKAEDGFSMRVRTHMDLLTELPYASVPPSQTVHFPSFSRAAVFVFERVLFWEPRALPSLMYLYITSSHVYIARQETEVFRCIPIPAIKALFLTTKRDDRDSQCALLIKLHPTEPDCFVSFEADVVVKRLVWILLEIQMKYSPEHPFLIKPVASLSEPGIDAQCARPPNFELHVEPVKRRKIAPLNSELAASIPVTGSTELLPRSKAAMEMFSKLHEAIIEKDEADSMEALVEVQEAALIARQSRGIVDLSATDRKTFGNGGSVRSMSEYQRSMILAATSRSKHRGATGELVINFVHHDPEVGEAGSKRGGGFHVQDDENIVNPKQRLLDPIQRSQFFEHSVSGLFGTATAGKVTGAYFSADESRSLDTASSPQQSTSTLRAVFDEADDPSVYTGRVTFGTRDASPSVTSSRSADAAARMDTLDKALLAVLDAPMGQNISAAASSAIMSHGILGVSELIKPTPLDNHVTFRREPPAGAWRTPPLPATPPSPSFSNRQSPMHSAPQPMSVDDTYVNAAIAPSPAVQRQQRREAADFPDIGGSALLSSPPPVRSTDQNSRYRKFLLEKVI